MGRFLSEDPATFQDDPNLYVYVFNDPINFTDPLGEFAVPAGPPTIGPSIPTGTPFVSVPIQRRTFVPIATGIGDCIITIAGQEIRVSKPELLFAGKAGKESKGNNPKQDKKLSKQEIRKLQGKGIDVEKLKGRKGSDLFKDRQGNIKIKPKNGLGPGEPAGINIDQL